MSTEQMAVISSNASAQIARAEHGELNSRWQTFSCKKSVRIDDVEVARAKRIGSAVDAFAG